MSNFYSFLVNNKNILYSNYRECDTVIYPSIDKLLLHIDSKYRLVHIVAQRSNEINETSHLQMPKEEYVSSKNIGKSLEEVEKDLIEIKKN